MAAPAVITWRTAGETPPRMASGVINWDSRGVEVATKINKSEKNARKWELPRASNKKNVSPD